MHFFPEPISMCASVLDNEGSCISSGLDGKWVECDASQNFAKFFSRRILIAEIIKTVFSTHFQEFDFSGFRNDDKNYGTKNWTKGTKTNDYNQRYYEKLWGDALPDRRRIKISLRNVVGILTKQKPPQQPKVTDP